MRLKSTAFIFCVSLSTLAARCQTPATLQLIRDVRAFDGEHVLEHRSVLIEDGKISRIGGPALKVDNAEVIDGRGRTLLPDGMRRPVS
jgi:imidazolonepropionase-like amidohydrolase